MARVIIEVDATQIVTSETNPGGILSHMPGYPITFDSVNYNNDLELTMNAAKGEYHDRLGKNYKDTNPNRVMKTVTLEIANGQQKLHESIGSYPADPEQPNTENTENTETPAEPAGE